MSANTAIQWCDDSVSFWWGCQKIAPGCSSCYALSIAKRYGRDIWGPTKPRARIASAAETLLKLNRKAEKEGRPRLVFINSMSDFFEDFDGPIIDRKGKRLQRGPFGIQEATKPSPHTSWATMGDMRREAFEVFDQCQWLRLLLLTKRPENVRRMWEMVDYSGKSLKALRSNVWLGCSISDQPTADAAIPELLKCRDLTPVLFCSYEPALAEVNFRRYFAHSIHCKYGHPGGGECQCSRLDWLICGGESGRNARPCNLDWIRSAVKQCQEAEVRVFVKQLGSNPVFGHSFDRTVKPGRVCGFGPVADSKGGDPTEWPEDLRVREYPEVRHA